MFRMKMIVVAGIVMASVALTVAQDKPSIHIKGTWTVERNGDIVLTEEYHLPMMLYRKAKADQEHMLRFRAVDPHRSDLEVTEKSARWDDANRKLYLTFRIKGLMERTKRSWRARIFDLLQYSNTNESECTVHFHQSNTIPYMGKVDGQVTIRLPEGSKNIGYDRETRMLSYRPGWETPERSDGDPESIKLRLRVPDQVISAAYKSYGLKDNPAGLWLVKTVLENRTGGTMKDLKVRYRVRQYADWSEWHRYPVVEPNQTIVDLYNPLFSEDVAKLDNRTPAEVSMEMEYTGADGETYEVFRQKRFTLLSQREFYFTDLPVEERTGSFQDNCALGPYIVSWVTPQDPPIARLASQANKAAGGIGARQSDAHTQKLMEAIWHRMCQAQITYQHPQSMAGKDKKFDMKFVQFVQFPRDTVFKKSGTCIDLAILYAAMLESVGIESVLIFCDGHCFPVGVGPKTGAWYPVEATCLPDPDFAKARKIGAKELEQLRQNGRFVPVNCKEYWSLGISQPELDPLPEDWQVMVDKRTIIILPGDDDDDGAKDDDGKDDPKDNGDQQVVAKLWSYTVSLAGGGKYVGRATVQVVNPRQMVVVCEGTYEQKGTDGKNHIVKEILRFQGPLDKGQFEGGCVQAVSTYDGKKIVPRGALNAKLKINFNADYSLGTGTLTNPSGVQSSVSLKPME
jgi:hypothetical protein